MILDDTWWLRIKADLRWCYSNLFYFHDMSSDFHGEDATIVHDVWGNMMNQYIFRPSPEKWSKNPLGTTKTRKNHGKCMALEWFSRATWHRTPPKYLMAKFSVSGDFFSPPIHWIFNIGQDRVSHHTPIIFSPFRDDFFEIPTIRSV